MTANKYNKEEIHRIIEDSSMDKKQKEALLKLLENNPDLEEFISKKLLEKNTSFNFVKSNSPASSSSSPVNFRSNNTHSGFYSGSPHSTSSSPIGSNRQVAKTGCFIATAAFGTPYCESVETLKSFRDNFLQKSLPGRALIHLYYKFSPLIANFISDKPFLRKLVRKTLSPLILFSKHCL